MQTYHRMYTSSVASLDKKSDVCIHEWGCHGNGGSVWENKFGVVTESLDDAEDVIPATAVETGRMVTKLVNDLANVSG